MFDLATQETAVFEAHPALRDGATTVRRQTIGLGEIFSRSLRRQTSGRRDFSMPRTKSRKNGGTTFSSLKAEGLRVS